MLSPEDIGTVFDGAIKGFKSDDFGGVQDLSNLLISLGGAVRDDTMVLVGVSVANASAMILQLKAVTLLDAQGIDKLMTEVTRDSTKALKDLKKLFVTWDQLDTERLVSALALLAKSHLKVIQKLTQLQQSGAMPPLGGTED